MLTDYFYAALASQLRDAAVAGEGVYIAVGAGDHDWDRNPPLPDRTRTHLTNELARKQVTPADVTCLDACGTETGTPTPCLRLRVRFEAGEAVGALRELGLFASAGVERDSGTLLSYFMHAPIEKTADMSLERTIHLDLSPRRASGIEPTRYLGNSRSREVHDLENVTAACQIGEILFDRRLFFASAEQAIELGYDLCAYCFGRGRSTR